MPGFARFYSATEAEALENIRQLLPRTPESAPRFTDNDAEKLSDMLDGQIKYQPCSRNDTNQPTFHPLPAVQSVEKLLNASTFSISNNTVYRDKAVRYASSSEGCTEWKVRSRTPSSDEASPQRIEIPSPTSSVRAGTSGSSSDSLEGDTSPVTSTIPGKCDGNTLLYPDYYATYSKDILQNMDTQFSKWSYDLREFTTAIPFVSAQAPADTHESLVKVDRKLWGAKENQDISPHDRAATEVLARVRKTKHKAKNSTGRTAPEKRSKKDKKNTSNDDKSMSKRAAIIVKSRETKDSSVVTNKSATQRRSAMHKNRKRRSIMPSPPPTTRKHEPERKAEPKTEQSTDQSRPTFFILNHSDDDQRRDVDSALQNRRLDFDNRVQLQDLMSKLGNAVTNQDSTGSSGTAEQAEVSALPSSTSITDDLEDIKTDSVVADELKKMRRLKGKSRKDAKSKAAQ